MDTLTRSRRLAPDTRWRDTWLAVGVGLAVLGFVLYAVYALSNQAGTTGGATGMIVAKEFVSQPETQVTVGKGVVRAQQVAGEYILHVRVPEENNKVYRVYVDPVVYQACHEGERFYFIRPR